MENFHLILQGNVLLLENIEGGGAACVNGCMMLMPIIEVDETNNNVLPFTVNVPVL